MQDFIAGVDRFEQGKMNQKDLQKAISTLYFEARKAIEYRFAKDQDKK
jgi:hypothetical protein